MIRKYLIIILLSANFVSCKFVEGVIYSDEVVAKVGKETLLRSDLEEILPVGSTVSDSMEIVSRYIDKWRLERLLLSKAEEELPDSEKDVSRELESYRRALLTYRYEQKYVNERLDTAVSRMEMEEFYMDNLAAFRTEFPLFRGYLAKMKSSSPNLTQVRYALRRLSDSDTSEMESLSMKFFNGYHNFYDYWVSSLELSKDFNMDVTSFVQQVRNSDYMEREIEGITVMMRIWDCIPSGATMPLDYCENSVRDVILSKRKMQLLHNLEQELLREGRLMK